MTCEWQHPHHQNANKPARREVPQNTKLTTEESIAISKQRSLAIGLLTMLAEELLRTVDFAALGRKRDEFSRGILLYNERMKSYDSIGRGRM